MRILQQASISCNYIQLDIGWREVQTQPEKYLFPWFRESLTFQTPHRVFSIPHNSHEAVTYPTLNASFFQTVPPAASFTESIFTATLVHPPDHPMCLFKLRKASRNTLDNPSEGTFDPELLWNQIVEFSQPLL